MGRVMYFVVGVALVPEAILEKLEPMLNPLQYLVVAACSSHRSTIYPQEYVIVWCSTCLIFRSSEKHNPVLDPL